MHPVTDQLRKPAWIAGDGIALAVQAPGADGRGNSAYKAMSLDPHAHAKALNTQPTHRKVRFAEEIQTFPPSA